MSIGTKKETPLETSWITGNELADGDRQMSKCRLRRALPHLTESAKSFKAFINGALVDWQDEGSIAVEPFLFLLQQELITKFAAILKRAQLFEFTEADLRQFIVDCEEAVKNLDAGAEETHAMARRLRSERTRAEIREALRRTAAEVERLTQLLSEDDVKAKA
jgi:hypothetical protein